MLKPLTGTYTRPAGVRKEIEEVLKQPLPVAFRKAAEGALKPQTLVYLMRNFRPNQRTREHDNLVVAFLSRLERFGDRLIRSFSEVDREKINGEVMNIALELINEDKLDIFEMSFKRGATCLYLDARAKFRLRAQTEISRDDLVPAESDMTGEEAADALSFIQDDTLPLAEARAMLRQVREKLKETEWLALFYVEGMGLTDKEAGAQMNCSARNIQYLLTKARKKVRSEERGARPNTRAKVKS